MDASIHSKALEQITHKLMITELISFFIGFRTALIKYVRSYLQSDIKSYYTTLKDIY